MVSIPRDYYVQLHGTTGYKDKLTHAGSYGVEMSIKTIEDLIGIDINYYIRVNFTSVVDIVNAIGGADVYSEYNFTSIEGYNYSKGYNNVDGTEALWFARERKAFIDGDRQRGRNQQALIDALFRKATSKAIITKYNSLLNAVNGSFVTNMSPNRITSLIKMQLTDNKKWILTSTSMDGTDSTNYTYTYSNQLLYVMEPDMTSVEAVKDLISKVYNNQKLSSSYDEANTYVNKVIKYAPIYYPEEATSQDSSANNNDVSNAIYTVTFDSAGGTLIANQSVNSNALAYKPVIDPTKDGYQFLGWYDESGTAYDFSNIVMKNINLIAQWKKNEDVSIEDSDKNTNS
jgi:LCP family protein required for cell wall assembly/uncharacterized repeat protein (TIGR02543 family)